MRSHDDIIRSDLLLAITKTSFLNWPDSRKPAADSNSKEIAITAITYQFIIQFF